MLSRHHRHFTIVISAVSFSLLWILSTSEPCGFFPLGDAVFLVVFGAVVDSFHFRAVRILSTRRLIVGVIDVIIVVVVIVIVLFAVIVFVVVIVQRSERREQPEQSRYRQPDVVNSVAISALARI